VVVVPNASVLLTRIPIPETTTVTTTKIPKMGTTKTTKMKTTPMTISSATILTMGTMTQTLVIMHADLTKATARALIPTMTATTPRGRAVVTPPTPDRFAKGTASLHQRR
jgi:hypothetical protein